MKLCISFYKSLNIICSKIFAQLSISYRLLAFSLNKDQFFYIDRAKLIEIIKATMKIDDLIVLITGLTGVALASYEVFSISFNKLKTNILKRIHFIMILQYIMENMKLMI